MRKIMDVNPFKIKRDDEDGAEAERRPRFQGVKNLCRACWPNSVIGWVIFALALVILWQVLVSWGLLPSLTFPAVDSNSWQAVFLTNGEIYFGHLRELNKDYVLLKDVYYLKVSQQLQPPETQNQPNITLVKLGSGDELHRPEGKMYIPKSQIIYWETMQKSSAVVQAIESTL